MNEEWSAWMLIFSSAQAKKTVAVAAVFDTDQNL